MERDLSLDTISSLPPTIIENILCLVPIQDAVRTSVLSKDWRYKWTKIPKLVFALDPCKIPEEVSFDENPLEQTDERPSERMFMSRRFKLLFAIYQVLLVHQGPILDFTLSMDPDETCAEIDQIIAYLSRKNTVKKLTLELSPWYRLPLSVFSLHQLTELLLMDCTIDHEPTFNGFGNLTVLYFDHVTIFKETLLHLLSNCPSLESFTMVRCYFNMGTQYLSEYRMLSQIMTESNILGFDRVTVIQLFECLRVIEDMTFSSSFLECFFGEAYPGELPREVPTSLVHLEYFSLEGIHYADRYCLPFIVLLIRSSPNLQTLKLQYQRVFAEYFSPDKIDLSVTQLDYSDIWLEHLYELEIKNFANLKHEMKFLMVILANSPVLMKVDIVLDRVVTENEMLKMRRILSRFPCASRVAKINVESYI